MNKKSEILHVNPTGENWDVESTDATLGQAETKGEAIQLAEELAEAAGAETVHVHTAVGQVEAEIPVEGEKNYE
jgi:nucleotide-binding universal stress UspA family protein